MATQIQVRRDTAANWTSNNPTLSTGEFGYDTTNDVMKVGDGTTAWDDLQAVNSQTYVPAKIADAVTYGDGVTDATSHIQGLIDSVEAAGGGTVFIPEGTYLVGALTVEANNVRITGEGWGSILQLDANTNDSLLSLSGAGKHVVIDHLRLNGDSSNQSGTSWGITMADRTTTNGDWCLFDALFVNDFLTGGINIGAKRQGNRITRSKIQNSVTYGVYLDGPDNVVESCGIGASDYPVYVASSSNHITSCNIFSGIDGITFESDAVDSEVTGCVIDAHTNRGAVVSGVGDGVHRRVGFIGCLFRNNSKNNNGTYPHIRIASANGVVVTGCRFFGTTITGSYAIETTGTDPGVTVSANTYGGAYANATFSDITVVDGIDPYLPDPPQIVLTPNEMESSQGSPTKTVVGSSTLRPAVWLMDASTVESVSFSAVLPDTWQTFKVQVWWLNASTGSGDVAWRLDYGFVAVGESATASGTTGSNNTSAADSQNVIVQRQVNASITNEPGELFTGRVVRVANAAGDTLANDAGLVALVLTPLT